MIFVIIYIIGFILTLTFLKVFGKKMEIDYDPPHEPDHDTLWYFRSKINAERIRDIWIGQDRKVMDVPNRIFYM